MRDFIEDHKLVVALAIVIALFIGAAFLIANKEKNEWNDGQCTCGGHWVYKDAVSLSNGKYVSVKYIYQCDECGKMIDQYFLR
jgi:hypothetical protein